MSTGPRIIGIVIAANMQLGSPAGRSARFCRGVLGGRHRDWRDRWTLLKGGREKRSPSHEPPSSSWLLVHMCTCAVVQKPTSSKLQSPELLSLPVLSQ